MLSDYIFSDGTQPQRRSYFYFPSTLQCSSLHLYIVGAAEPIDLQIVRTPLLMLPLVLSSLSNALVAINRISKFLIAEELADPYLIDESLEAAVIVDGDFTWEKTDSRVDQGAEQGKGAVSDIDKGNKKRAKQEEVNKKDKTILPTTAAEVLESPPGEGDNHDSTPFELKNLKITIPKGSFVAVVGQVGSGKVIVVMDHILLRLSHPSELCSSVLDWGDASDEGRGMLPRISHLLTNKGQVIFGGTVAYVPQSPWMRNATLRENVLFGQEDDEKRLIIRSFIDHKDARISVR